MKDGQIVEQGSLRELIEKEGIFAAMWANQVTADEPAPSVTKPEEVSLPAETSMSDDTKIQPPPEDAATEAGAGEQTVGDEQPPLESAVETTTEPSEDKPSASYAEVAATEPQTDAPVVDAAPAPVAFPTSDDTSEPFPAPIHVPGVTFDSGVQFPSPRASSPDLAAEPKRKRTASQNLQRFARRVSLVARRSGSSTSIPKQEAPQSRSSKDGDSIQAEGSVSGEPEVSAPPSEDGKSGKKDKKQKKRSSLK